jgi:addiction module HigA family antidote
MRPARNPFHPGEILLEEFLGSAKITQTAVAEKIGWSRSRLSEFIHGKRGVTADAAIDLAEALGTSSKLWMNLQATYDLHRAMSRRQKVA